jgi:hypothetical protein
MSEIVTQHARGAASIEQGTFAHRAENPAMGSKGGTAWIAK